MVGAFKRKLIASDIVEMNKIAGGIDEATKAHYLPIIEKQEELIEVFKSFVPDLQKESQRGKDCLDFIDKLESELQSLESEAEDCTCINEGWTKKGGGVYYCSVCHQNIVDAENGYDTCSDCVNKI